MAESIIAKIKNLKKQKNAVILAHNYQIPEVQDIADFVGDSLGLSIEASKTRADVIVFCGVYFMAETAKILSPQKKVVIPDEEAGCPMVDMINAAGLKKLKRQHPHAKVLCYVNTPADVKAEADICCTSANAVKVVQKLLMGEKEVIFVPDKYLTRYVSTQTGRDFISWHGYCPTHVRISTKDILAQKKLHPKAKVMVHPECTPEVIKLADRVFSTEGMRKHMKTSEKEEFIVGTEAGMVYRLHKENPDKLFYPASEEAICPNMKRTTLEKVMWALEDEKHEIVVAQDIISRARQSIEIMVKHAG